MKLLLDSVPLGDTPLIAGVVTDTDILTGDPADSQFIDILELRIDMFQDLSYEHVRHVFWTAKDQFKKPIIATVRDVREGGQKEIPDRLILYKKVAPLASALDTEVFSEDIVQEVKKLCITYGTLLIGSYHNFTATPEDNCLESIVVRGKRSGVDIVKIATMAKDRADLIRLLLFTLKHQADGVITMAMGDAGLVSRVISPLFGSLVTYGYVSTPSAPGQLSARELFDLFRTLKIR